MNFQAPTIKVGSELQHSEIKVVQINNKSVVIQTKSGLLEISFAECEALFGV